MAHSGLPRTPQEVSGRLWRFAQCEFDELRRELRVNGVKVDLEVKPLEVLLQLLLHAGEVITKDELLESVWPGTMVVDGSLATAISKLRKALEDEQSSIVLTIPRVGYRLAVPVHCKVLATASIETELHLKPGEAVPGREHWRLIRSLDNSGNNEVWLAENPKTHEARVFKFAPDGVRLKGLKREATLSRFLRESLGERSEFVRVLEWNFDTPPFFLESEYSGPNLAEWAESQGGLDKVPLETRVKILADVADAIAGAHSVGVLHKDLKPTNILVVPKSDGEWQIKVADFGSASLTEPSRLKALGITNLGFTRTGSLETQALTGTLMYLAPEVLAGQSPTGAADVYSLGVMLYQLAVCDVRKPLTAGWEAEIGDALIREDVADAACGDPAKRLNSAAALAERLRTLQIRRIARDELELARQRAEIAERKLAESRARLPWVVVTAATLTVALVVSIFLYVIASRERDHANRQTAIATAINQFLSNDLLGRSNPFQSGKADESFVDAVKQASPNIDQQFKGEPLIAARLHQTIGRALDNRSNWADARREYDRATVLFRQADGQSNGPYSQDAIITQLQLASMEARIYEPAALATAKSIVADQEAAISKLANPRPDVRVWLESAQGMIALIENNAQSAVDHFQSAFDKSKSLAAFDESARLTLEQRLGFAYIRLGDGAKAENLFRELISGYSSVSGPGSPNVLRVRLNLAQAFMIQGKFQDAVNETNAIEPDFVLKLGPEHDLTMQLLSTRAESEGGLEMWDDAFRDDMAIHNLAMKKTGANSFYAIATLSDASLSQCRGNHLAEGEANARKAYEESRKAFGERAGLTGGAAYTLASCLISMDKLPEASKLLADIDVKAVAQLAGIQDWGANVDLAEGEIAYRQRDYKTARKLVQSATPVFTRSDAEAFQRRALQNLTAEIDKRLPPK